jgi:hypothetical protein
MDTGLQGMHCHEASAARIVAWPKNKNVGQ